MLESKISQIPCYFSCSREFRQRKVSARLRAPPDSLDCREYSALVSAKVANFGRLSRFLLVKRHRGERTTVAVAPTSQAFFFAAAISSPTTEMLRRTVCDHKPSSYEKGLNFRFPPESRFLTVLQLTDGIANLSVVLVCLRLCQTRLLVSDGLVL
jgi:hypothetical protein